MCRRDSGLLRRGVQGQMPQRGDRREPGPLVYGVVAPNAVARQGGPIAACASEEGVEEPVCIGDLLGTE